MASVLACDSYSIHPLVEELFTEMVEIRRSIHQEPEILFDLPKTRAKILAFLQGLDLEVHSEVGTSGIVAIIRNPGPCILLSADMDGLCISETNINDYSSKHPGKMHACGHDGHIAMLLIAAKILSKVSLKGSVKFVFQPAEEGGHGAREMINDAENPALMNPDVDKVFGMHITNAVNLGNFIAASKYASCSSDYFIIEILGTGAHASAPHLSIDPIAAGTQLVVALQTIVARNVDPQHQAVLSVTMFNSGEVINAIPDCCKISGTIRTFEPFVREIVEERVKEVCDGIERGFKCKVNLKLVHYYDPIVNDEACNNDAAKAFLKISKKAQRGLVAPMIGEDFFYFTLQKPGSFIMLGCATEEKKASLHSPNFDFDEQALMIGASYWVQLIEDLLT